MTKIKRAIVPVAGLGTRFLPISKVLPKELLPLVDKPIIQYIAEEAVRSGIKEIIFINRPEKKEILDYFRKYFRKSPELEEILKNRKKNHLLRELDFFEKFFKEISFSQVFQREPLGDGHAILQAQKLIKNQPCAILFGDDVIESKVPCLWQLIKVFGKYQRPIVALHRLPKEKLPLYGIVKTRKITSRLYQIKEIREKPSIKAAPSNLAIVGRYIITPEVFSYLKRIYSKTKKGEIGLSRVLEEMIKDGKTVLGYEFKGKWLECGNKQGWLESNFYLSLKHPIFGLGLKNIR